MRTRASGSTRITFKNSHGLVLAARLNHPGGAPVAHALFAHCFTCSKDVLAASRIARGLADRGIATLRFDFPGLGQSEGDFADQTFSSNVADVVAAADYMRTTLRAPEILIGHSLGGAAVLSAAGKIREVKAVATIGTPADPAHVAHLFDRRIGEIEARGKATVMLMDRPFTVKKAFLEDISRQNQMQSITALNKALLVMHSPMDTIVGIENAGTIFAAAKHPKSFISLDDADHLITRREDAAYIADILVAWSGRWIGHKPIDP